MSQVIGVAIPEPESPAGDAIPEEAHEKYKNYLIDIFKAVNTGTQLLKTWEKILLGIAKPTKEQEQAKTFIKYINVALKNNNYANYKEFLKRAKEVNAGADELKPFETCPQGFTCLYHSQGNWLEAWKKASAELKLLDKLRAKEADEKEKPPCECLHCSHGLGNWTWIDCPFYPTSEYKHNLEDPTHRNYRGTIGDPKGGKTHWKPPHGWTPFWDPTGRPWMTKINKQLGDLKDKYGVDYKWFNPQKDNAPRANQAHGVKETINTPGDQSEPAAQAKPTRTTEETETTTNWD
jgi:hypothetical protein